MRFGLLAVGLIEASGSSFRYSAFSSIVTHARIGGQEVLIGLEFTESESFLFGPGEFCPAFVGNCFDSHRSPTFRLADTQQVSERFLGGFYGEDSVEINSVKVLRVPLFVMTTLQPMDLRFREVTGSIGAGKYSVFFANQRVSFSEELYGFVNRPVVSILDLNAPRLGHRMLSQTANGWDFGATVSFSRFGSERELLSDITMFDPSVQDLLIPVRFLEGLRQWLGEEYPVDAEGRLLADCGVARMLGQSFTINIALKHASNHVVRIPWNVYSFPSGQGHSRGIRIRDRMRIMCPTRVVFTDSVLVVTIGRMLLRSVEQVILDYAGPYLEIVPFVLKADLGPYPTPAPLVPLHKLPIITEDESGVRIVFPQTVDNHGYLLLGASPRERNDLTCWEFVDTRGHRPGSPNTRSFEPSLFTLFNIGIREDETVFSFLRGDSSESSFELSVIFRGHQVSVCKRSMSLEKFGLPPSKVVTEESDYNGECSVCLTAFARGDMGHDWGACTHKFHVHCIRPWLMDGKTTCPFCREKISRRIPRETLRPISEVNETNHTPPPPESCCAIS